MIVMEHTSVIVHDTTGRDYACLLVSLVQIMTDPYYRTVVGLQSLIQKEWVTKGHPFSQRLGLILNKNRITKNKLFRDDNHSDREESPVFILFLDCIHQLWTQFPSLFGYTEYFLLLILDSMHMCLFETFLFDSEYDRQKFKSGELESLWDFLATSIPPAKFQTLFLNPIYNVTNTLKDGTSRSDSGSGAEFMCPEFWGGQLTEHVSSTHTLPRQNQKPAKSKSNSLPHSFNFQYQSFRDPNISVINPDASCIRVQLWHKHFLRWSLAVDLCKGSSFELAQYLQQSQLLEEVNYLEDRLEYLTEKLDKLENPASDDECNSAHGSVKIKKSKHGGKDAKLADENYTDLLSKFTFCYLIHMD